MWWSYNYKIICLFNINNIFIFILWCEHQIDKECFHRYTINIISIFDMFILRRTILLVFSLHLAFHFPLLHNHLHPSILYFLPFLSFIIIIINLSEVIFHYNHYQSLKSFVLSILIRIIPSSKILLSFLLVLFGH